jgi:hypothetical protein
MAWHDAMVAHERRLRSGQTTDVCDDECPHVEARALWAETVAMLGARANELTFLRGRALAGAPSDQRSASPKTVSPEADTGQRLRATRTGSAARRSESLVDAPDPSPMATAELYP